MQNTETTLQKIVQQLLTPGKITRKLIQHELRRARRLGAPWKRLTQHEKALLKAAAQTPIKTYHPHSLATQTLARIIAEIETHTMRGHTLLTALKHITARKPVHLANLLNWAKRKLDYLKYLGKTLITLQEHYYNILVN